MAKKTAEEAVWKFAKSHPEIDVATGRFQALLNHTSI